MVNAENKLLFLRLFFEQFEATGACLPGMSLGEHLQILGVLGWVESRVGLPADELTEEERPVLAGALALLECLWEAVESFGQETFAIAASMTAPQQKAFARAASDLHGWLTPEMLQISCCAATEPDDET